MVPLERDTVVHLWGGNEVGVLPLRRVCVGLLVGKGCGSGRWWRDVCCGHGVGGCGRSGRCDQWVGGSESRGKNDRVEFSLGCGVRSGAVGLGGGRPRFWVWSGLLFLMETQSLYDGVGLCGLVVELSGSGLRGSMLQDVGSGGRAAEVIPRNRR